MQHWNWRNAIWGAIACVLISGEAAAAPWQHLALFKRIDADPEASYVLAEEQGPWLILVTTFIGDGSQERARQLCYELRKDYKLKAYTHRMHFKFIEEDNRRRAAAGRPLRYRNSESEEVAVLVGDFTSVDDPKAQKTLKMVKHDCRPKCLLSEDTPEKENPITRLRGVFVTVPTQAGLRTLKKERSLLANAHLTANPLLPDEYYAPKGLDKFVISLNEPLKHSLLECRGKYTVKIATFSGRVVIDQNKIKMLEATKEPSSELAEAGDKAHRLTLALREQGYEAYEFHDRGQSIVAVGSFDSVGTPRADGKTEINPSIHTVMTTFGAEKSIVPGRPSQVGLPKVIAGIPLDVQPMIVQTPRRSISSDYAAEGFRGR